MDLAKLLKTQDAGYLQTVLQQTRKEREKVEKDVILAETDLDSTALAQISGKRKVFGEDGEVIKPGVTSLNEDFSDEEPEERPDEKGMSKEQVQARRRKRRTQEALHSRLEALVARENDLAAVLERLHDQRAKMHNTIGGVNKDGVKFKVRERKR